MNPKLTRLILIGLAVIISTITFEIILRIFTPMPTPLAKLKSSSQFLYENNPSRKLTYRIIDGVETDISINSWGFRDEEFRKEKSPGVYRIAVIGDSQEEALQVPLSKTWQKVMAKNLSEDLVQRTASEQLKFRRVETYNFGVSGYGTDQEWLTLRDKVWQFSPDMIILAFSPNDVGDTYKNKLIRLKNGQIEVVSQEERAGGNFLGKFARKTYLYHLVLKASQINPVTKSLVSKVRTKILGFSPEEKFFLSDAQLVQGPFEVLASQKNPPKEVMEGWQLVKACISDMKKQAQDHQAKFLITINIPRDEVKPQDWQELSNRYKLDLGNSSPYQINEVIKEITASSQINFYDPRLDAIEWKEQNGDLHYAGDGHFNENGNLFMGTKEAEFIKNQGLIN